MDNIDSYPSRIWSGILRDGHRTKLGMAIYEYLWLIDKVTYEKDGKGYVLYSRGKCREIKIEDIAEELGSSYKTVQRNLQRLQQYKYITMSRTPHGYQILINKSKKFKKRVVKSVQSQNPPDRTHLSTHRLSPDRTHLSTHEGQRLDTSVQVTGHICPVRPDTSVQSLNKVLHNTVHNKDKRETFSQIKDLLLSFPADIQILIQAYWDIASQENKTGKITDGRKLTLLTELKEVRDRSEPAAFAYALQEANKHEAPNVNYIKRIIGNREKHKRVEEKLLKERREKEMHAEKMVRQAIEELGRFSSGPEDIKKWLQKLPRQCWERLRRFYVRRYPEGGRNWGVAIVEVEREGRG